MKRRQLALWLLSVLLSVTSCDAAKSGVNKALGRYRAYGPTPLPALLAGAGDAKPVLLVFGGNWCPWCKRLDEKIDGDDDVRALFDRYQLVHVDIAVAEDWNRQHNEPFKLGYPLLVPLDAQHNPKRFISPHSLIVGGDYSVAKLREALGTP
jgi:thioredoxin-related protein